MNSKAIHIEGLSKSYRIGHRREKTLRGSLGQGLLSLFRPSTLYETFWALQDIDLEVSQGEVLGIIGRNGAGKTTLLKLLSRITYPSRGYFEIHGRVASLLEVGTGFHPELSGRENIFLNGTILGMTRQEVRSRFDEIVDFSGIEHFLDTPVKRYSSGMFVRLAFSVAAHLEPEVLIIDEVLAVGDAAFQRKSLGKMGQVAKEGRTVLFVSHNMSAIGQLCQRAIWIENGHIFIDGPANEVIDKYLSTPVNQEDHLWRRTGNGKVIYTSLGIGNTQGVDSSDFQMGDDMYITLGMQFREDVRDAVLGISITNAAGDRITHILNDDEGFNISGGKGQEKTLQILFPKVYLAPGSYNVSIGIEKYAEIFEEIEHALKFTINQGNRVKRTVPYPGNVRVYLPGEWKWK